MTELNVYAPCFMPSVSLLKSIELKKHLSKEVSFDKLEDDWFNVNKDMFEDDFESIHKALKGGLIPYEKVTGDRIFVRRYFIVGLSTIYE